MPCSILRCSSRSVFARELLDTASNCWQRAATTDRKIAGRVARHYWPDESYANVLNRAAGTPRKCASYPIYGRQSMTSPNSLSTTDGTKCQSSRLRHRSQPHPAKHPCAVNFSTSRFQVLATKHYLLHLPARRSNPKPLGHFTHSFVAISYGVP